VLSRVHSKPGLHRGWNNYEEAQKAGIAVDLPIYDMIVPLSAHWDNSKRDAWKKTSCSQQDRKTDYTSAFYSASYEVNPITATSWTQCIKDACVPASLACGLEQTSSAVVFEARWRRQPGRGWTPRRLMCRLSVLRILSVRMLPTWHLARCLKRCERKHSMQ